MLKIEKFKIPLGSWYKPIVSIIGEKINRKDWNTTWLDPKNLKKTCFLQKRVFAMITPKLI
jgi:hypothetical protein